MLLAMRSGIDAALAGVADTPTATDAPAVPPSVISASLAAALVSPRPRPIVAEGAASETLPEDEGEVVTRMTTAGGRHWGVNVGRFTTRHEAEKMLLKTALVEIGMLESALRKVEKSPQGFEANFVGLTEQSATRVCQRLQAQDMACDPVNPG